MLPHFSVFKKIIPSHICSLTSGTSCYTSGAHRRLQNETPEDSQSSTHLTHTSHTSVQPWVQLHRWTGLIDHSSEKQGPYCVCWGGSRDEIIDLGETGWLYGRRLSALTLNTQVAVCCCFVVAQGGHIAQYCQKQPSSKNTEGLLSRELVLTHFSEGRNTQFLTISAPRV